MCPDPQILSIYLDGELPSPWKEKMEAHLAVCPKCQEKLRDYKHVQEIFRKGADSPTEQKRIIVENDGSAPTSVESGIGELLENSKEKVWERLASRQRYNTAGLVRKSGNIRNYSVWRKKISIPLPLAVAAALLVIFGAMFLPGFIGNNQINPTEFANFTISSYEENIPMIPVDMDYMQDMNSVLQYLDANGADIIILQLPESRNFSRAGEPAIIRAADYSTRRQPR